MRVGPSDRTVRVRHTGSISCDRLVIQRGVCLPRCDYARGGPHERSPAGAVMRPSHRPAASRRGRPGSAPSSCVRDPVPAVRTMRAAATPLAAGFVVLPPPPAEQVPEGTATMVCDSDAGGQEHCPCDSSSGVALRRSLGPAVCLPGETWGCDDTGAWVAGGCAGEFVVAGPGGGGRGSGRQKRRRLARVDPAGGRPDPPLPGPLPVRRRRGRADQPGGLPESLRPLRPPAGGTRPRGA